LQFFEAGPFTEKDIQDGVLEIDVPRPTGVNVIFDSSDTAVPDLPFESVQIDVSWRIPGNSRVCSVTNPRDKAAPTLRLTDLAPGTYRVLVSTSPKAGHATDPKTQAKVGRFADWRELTLKAGEPETVKFRYIPFDAQAFRGNRTAVVRLLNADGAVAKGKKLRITFLDDHYGFLPVFDGLVPDSGEVELEKLTDRNTNLAPKYRSYWVWLDDRHVGGFDLAAVPKPQRFEFQRALAVGDEAPNLEFIDIASRDRVPLTSLRGKIVLLELWATWCGPCQQAMRKLNDLADARKDDWKGRVALVAVSIDNAPDLAAKHADQRGWTSLRHLWSQRSESDFQSNVERAFTVGGVPTAILLDTDGKIVWYGHPVVDEPPLHERIEQLLTDLERAKR
jgi:thiol-disulfide isomerase/thioredoxin